MNISVSEPFIPTLAEIDNSNQVDEAYRELIRLTIAIAPIRVVMFAYVKYALARHESNKFRTAKALGIDRRSLQRWTKSGKIPNKQRD